MVIALIGTCTVVQSSQSGGGAGLNFVYMPTSLKSYCNSNRLCAYCGLCIQWRFRGSMLNEFVNVVPLCTLCTRCIRLRSAWLASCSWYSGPMCASTRSHGYRAKDDLLYSVPACDFYASLNLTRSPSMSMCMDRVKFRSQL